MPDTDTLYSDTATSSAFTAVDSGYALVERIDALEADVRTLMECLTAMSERTHRLEQRVETLSAASVDCLWHRVNHD